MTTPHERRVLENAARRRVIGDLEALIRSSTGAVPAAQVLASFEQASSSLPADSKLRATFDGLAARLRRQGSGRIAESGLRQVVARLRREADDLGRQLEARDAQLRAKHGH
jgi:hypothetical protein